MEEGTIGRRVKEMSLQDARVIIHQTDGGEGAGATSGEKGCRVGGFNVSNLMGITRRMIDIVKKITFYFLQNV
jgi:hypothetical protein